MNNDDFWNKRLTATKSRLIAHIIDYCDLYDILHDEVFSAEKVKRELSELIEKAVEMFITDNYE